MKNTILLLALVSGLSLPLQAADQAADFDSMIRAGFSQITAGANNAPAVKGAPATSAGGVFLHDSHGGKVFYCSKAGCRLIKPSGASLVVSSRRGGLYFTGDEGTGYCAIDGCRVLLRGARVTFPLGAGPRGDIWAANKMGGWHCTPSACAPAFSGAMETSGNFLDGVYKRNGDFVAESSEGVFWCSGDSCREVSPRPLLFVEDNCAGAPPQGVSFGFWSRGVSRCTPEGCRAIDVDDRLIDNYADCAFDAQGLLHLPIRGAGGSLACSQDGCERSGMATPRHDQVVVDRGPRDNEFSRQGDDGARYTLADNRMRPAGGAAGATRPPVVTRGSQVLAFDAPVSCWQWWTADDDDEVGPAWVENCKLVK